MNTETTTLKKPYGYDMPVADMRTWKSHILRELRNATQDDSIIQADIVEWRVGSWDLGVRMGERRVYLPMTEITVVYKFGER